MSFYSGSRNSCFPGPINGNPLNGLCEKACIQVKKVFDACLRQMQETDVQLTVSNYIPENPTQPLTFVSVTTFPNQTRIENLVVDRFDDKPCFARVSGTVIVPVQISYTDANSVAGTATSEISVNTDVVLYVPQPSVVPFTIEAYMNALSPDGEYVGDGVFNLDFCLSLIIRVVVEADLLVPTYGYCPIPPCQEFTQDVCSGFFELPLYPVQQTVCPSN